MEILLILFVLSIVQSLFGVGILLFGTPILLIMGHEYHEALMYLLPASAALSWSQVWDGRKMELDGGYRKHFFILCIPMLAMGMGLTQYLDLKYEIKMFVTFMLFAAFLLRTSERLRFRMQILLSKNLCPGLAGMGLIHGLSNMGGSILQPLVSGLYSDKNKVMAGVSFDYAFMATAQLGILILIQGHFLRSYHLIGCLIALGVRYLIGKKIFTYTRESYYQRLINGFILANAIVLSFSF